MRESIIGQGKGEGEGENCLKGGVNATPLEGSHNRKRLSSLIRDLGGDEEGEDGGAENENRRFVGSEGRHIRMKKGVFRHVWSY